MSPEIGRNGPGGVTTPPDAIKNKKHFNEF